MCNGLLPCLYKTSAPDKGRLYRTRYRAGNPDTPLRLALAAKRIPRCVPPPALYIFSSRRGNRSSRAQRQLRCNFHQRYNTGMQYTVRYIAALIWYAVLEPMLLGMAQLPLPEYRQSAVASRIPASTLDRGGQATP